MKKTLVVVALAVIVVSTAVAVAPFPCSTGTVIVGTDYAQQTAGYFMVKLSSSSQTGVDLQCYLVGYLELHV